MKTLQPKRPILPYSDFAPWLPALIIFAILVTPFTIGAQPPVRPDSRFLGCQQLIARGRHDLETGHARLALDVLTQALRFARPLDKTLYADALRYMALAQKRHGNNDSAVLYFEQYALEVDTLQTEKLLHAPDSGQLTPASARLSPDTARPSGNNANRPQPLATASSLPTTYDVLHADSPEAAQSDPGVPLQTSSRSGRLALVVGLAALVMISLLANIIRLNKIKTTKLLLRKNDQLSELNQQLLTTNESKARMFNIIGNDLRTPANQIRHWLQLERESHNSPQKSRTPQEEQLKTAAANLLAIMEDLLLWIRIQRRHFVPQRQPAQLAALLQKELPSLLSRLQEKQLTVINEVPADFTPVADTTFVSIILRNLLQNAIKHSIPNSSISIRAGGSDLRITHPTPLADVITLNELLQDRVVDSPDCGLGLQIANDLAVAIRAGIVFTRSEDGYLTTILSFLNELLPSDHNQIQITFA